MLSNFVFSCDLTREESLTQRAERDKTDSEFFKRRDDFSSPGPRTTASIRSEGQSPAEPRVRDESSCTPASDRPKCLTLPA